MIPIRDQIKPRRTPIINYLLIAVNIIVFMLQWSAGAAQESIVYEFALIPASFSDGIDLSEIRDVFSSMFMHAGLMHLLGNMLYLWIFGDNVEDAMGHFKYLLFYLAGGFVASIAHILVNPGSQIPTVGASGAIAASLGAYLVLYPRSRVATFIPLGFFMTLRMLPASIVLIMWFVLQLFNGVLTLGAADVGGTAFWAHIGGFVFGAFIGLFFRGKRSTRQVQQW
ncbi:MAG: rhomboid family intramembrane serine protease [Brevefilum sp.]|nr:rhomboid family intramembrane serine protease [Brevefilum sp.]MDT8381734.1 rhomboid family intramembrane serine protease [Brevefilum sp.]MDW7754051.1 rhomboid family intramembrane serine protease [Brevefilum sp.]